MTTFAAIAALCLVAAIGLLAWPLLGVGRPASGAPRARAAAAVAALVLPVAAILIYLKASNWDWDAPPPAPGVSAPDLQRVVEALQERLAKQPEDVEGWKILGRSATVLGDYALARRAFGEAYTRTQGRDADAVVGYAESRILIDEREIVVSALARYRRPERLAVGDPLPDLAADRLDGGERVELRSLARDRPLLLAFGSFT